MTPIIKMRKIAWYCLDWTNPDNYTNLITADTPDDVCAWEFLRRNLEYQYDYFEYARTGQFPFHIPHMKKIDRTDMCDWYSIDRESQNFNPHDDTSPTFFIAKDPAFTTRSFSDRNLPGEFIVRLSAESDRNSQLKAIENYFNKFKKEYSAKFTTNNTNYGIYLRILDALAVGVTEEKIIDERVDICKVENPKTAKLYVQQAKSLRDRNYIRIVGGQIYHPKPDEFKFSDIVFNAAGIVGELL